MMNYTRIAGRDQGRSPHRRSLALRHGLSALAVAAMMSVPPAFAQQADPAKPDPAAQTNTTEAPMEDIVVTASKTGAERLNRVPQAIQAFTGATLKERNIRDGADLIQLIPGASQAQEIAPEPRNE